MTQEMEVEHFAIESMADIDAVAEKMREKLANKQRPVVSLSYGKKIRTLTQNRALHVFFKLLCDGLNDAGMDMRRVLKPSVDIPWTPKSVKEYLWRPLQKAIIDEESTTQASTSEYTPVYQTLARHMAEKHGFRIPDWPSIR
jgi:hypothetical protein